MQLLIVDDDQIMLRGLVSILQRLEMKNLRIFTIDNAMDALEILKYQDIDLLITDVEMPTQTGLELIREIRRRNHCKRCIVISGYDKFEFAQQALRYQVQDYLLKPIDKAYLIQKVTEVYNDVEGVAQVPIPAEISSLPIFKITAEPEDMPDSLRGILAYIQAHYHRNLSLDDLSANFGIHSNYICVLFQKYMHTTYLKYLDSFRLQRSVTLLIRNPEMTIEQISTATGFMNERHFYKVFKKRIGITAGALRKKYRIPDTSKH